MNYGISILFRAIPLVMGLICFFYGGYIFLAGGDAGSSTAGPIVFFLGSICLTLFATAATIIRQIIHTYNKVVKVALPLFGYAVAIVTLVLGIIMFIRQPVPEYFVAGHVIGGLGLICMCVSTAATSSTKFSLIPLNSAQPREAYGSKPDRNAKGFTRGSEAGMIIFTAIVACVAWVWCVMLLCETELGNSYLIAGSVLGGIACVCTSLVALVASISRQIDNVYSETERTLWVALVTIMGLTAFIWGLVMIFLYWGQTENFVGFVLIGLSMVCFSILSKVLLLAKIWKAEFPLANRVPLIPVITALACLFLSLFLYEEAMFHVKFFVPARVVAGLGAVCFTLFSIVSILESGTKKSA